MSGTMEGADRFDAATHLNYDEADLKAITHGAAAMGVREDALSSVLFARQLDFVKTTTYERPLPAMGGARLVPVSSEVPEYATTVTTRYYDGVGIAKVISNYADDLPRVDVGARETTIKIQTIGDSYGYSINELRASQATGEGLDARKARVARLAIEQKLNRIVMVGDLPYGLFGLLNNPNVALVAPVTGNWNGGATTAEQILGDLNALYSAIVAQSNGYHMPNTLALPSVQLAAARSKYLLNSQGQTALGAFLLQHPGVTVEEVYELRTAGTGGIPAALLYERNADNLWHELVAPFNQLPPEARNLAFSVACMARTAGVTIQFPLAFAKMEGI